MIEKYPAHILIIDDNEDILTSARIVLRRHFERLTLLNHPEHIDHYLKDKIDLVLLDMNFTQGATNGKEGIATLKKIKAKRPDLPVVLMTAYGGIGLAVEAMKLGASDFMVKPWVNEELLNSVSNLLKISEQKKQFEQQQSSTSPRIELENAVIGADKGLKEVVQVIEKVAKTDANILILGENGTGKEVIARMIHEKSQRNQHDMLHVDLGALSESLFESELFGHEKGAFTGANATRKGRLEEASKTTLFLDEIGNIPIHLQVKLLSALQSRKINRLGSNQSISINPRLICATNMPIQKMVQEGSFRQDLLYRINTVCIELPALRDRMEDMKELCDYFLEKYSKRYNLGNNCRISKQAYQELLAYDWPGNIRELQHMIERGLILSDGNCIKSFNLASEYEPPMLNEEEEIQSLNLADIEKKAIQAALKKHQGNLSQAARELGLGRTTLYRKMTRYGI